MVVPPRGVGNRRLGRAPRLGRARGVLDCGAMNAYAYRPIQLLPMAVLACVLIGEPPEAFEWAEAYDQWGDEALRAALGVTAAALLYTLTRAEDRARARERPGWKAPGRLHTAVAIVVVCFLALVLFHLGW